MGKEVEYKGCHIESTESCLAFDKTTQATLNLKFDDNAVADFHEGYYVSPIRLRREQLLSWNYQPPWRVLSQVKIVTEFITWTPTADGGMNANWNNDDNWHRSSKGRTV